MNQNEIVLVKLFNGDMVMGKIQTSDTLSREYRLKDPRLVVMAPTMTGDVRLLITTICAPFKVARLNEDFTIPGIQAMFVLREDEIGKELIDGYKSEVSGIEIATPSQTAAINSNTAGEFIL